MKASDIIDALQLPSGARVDQRVPKKLFVENGAPTSADKRRINEGIEDVHWVAALKPTTVGVPAFRDSSREYLEIPVLSATFRLGDRDARLVELIHRALPYPSFLVTAHGDTLGVSLAHKRWSQGESGATVLDGDAVAVELVTGQDGNFLDSFLAALSITRQPRTDLQALYQGWVDTLVTLLSARIVGAFTPLESHDDAVSRRKALQDCGRLEAQMTSLRTAAARERQVARQVDLNMQLKRLQAEYSSARAKL